jgi:hypothetical protein
MLIFLKKFLFSKKGIYRISRLILKKSIYIVLLYWIEKRSLKSSKSRSKNTEINNQLKSSSIKQGLIRVIEKIKRLGVKK